ncbi:MAG: lipid IV(A) palmitoyltransferase PagP [Methylotenera sp.]|nr:lipid IV(A) palmitoyltransferase PagP [Methylotenera sp.]
MKHRFIAFMMLIMSSATSAEEPVKLSMWSRVQDSLSQTWESQNYELYIPVYTWHNRNYYSDEKINEFNENPWGLGIGKYRFDEDGDWHAFYVMAFQDSHKEAEPIAGYGFQKVWRPAEDVRLGVGYTVGITLRQDMHYLPIPVIAPLFSVAYKKLAVQSTYIPGGEGHGNILFTWLRWQMN